MKFKVLSGKAVYALDNGGSTVCHAAGSVFEANEADVAGLLGVSVEYENAPIPPKTEELPKLQEEGGLIIESMPVEKKGKK